MKNTYLRQLTLAARWLLPPEEAREVIAEYRDIVNAAPRDDESLRRDLGDPVEAMKLLVQPKSYRQWLAAFFVMAACLLLPAVSPLPGGWRLWSFFQNYLYRFPVELMLLAGGLGVSLFWFRHREADSALPKGLCPVLAVQAAGAAGAWAVMWLVLVRPPAAMDFFRAHTGLAQDMGLLLAWTGFLLALLGLWGLVQARLTDRRWRAAYVLGLTAAVLVMAVLSLLWDMSLERHIELYYYILLTALGLVGTGVGLC